MGWASFCNSVYPQCCQNYRNCVLDYHGQLKPTAQDKWTSQQDPDHPNQLTYKIRLTLEMTALKLTSLHMAKT